MSQVDIPDVSVIIPVYNAMPYLVRSLESVVGQSLGIDRIELVVVDDGSTDESGSELDSWAAKYPDQFRLVHASASGGPATPRNTGLDMATGRYVFFLDADDYLGDEALERLVAAADENESDIVLGRMATESIRGIPQSMYRRTDLDADLYESRVYWTLAALKLFRRDLLEDNHVRFPTNFPNCSDQPFTALAYLRSTKISVLGDYDYYHVVLRDDNGHVTRSGSISNRLDVVEAMCALLAREVPDPHKRAILLTRHFHIDLRRVISVLVEQEGPEQEALFARVVELVRDNFTPEISRRLPPYLRVVYYFAGQGMLEEVVGSFSKEGPEEPMEVTVERGRVFQQLPYFRDPNIVVPDELYDFTDQVKAKQSLSSFDLHDGLLQISGTAAFARVELSGGVEIVLRSREEENLEYSAPAESTPDGGYAASVDLLTVAHGEPLPAGQWDMYARVTLGELIRSARVSNGDLESAPTSGFASLGSDTHWNASAFLTPGGRLRLDVGGNKSRVGRGFRDWSMHWEGTDLLIGVTPQIRINAPLGIVVGNGAGDVRTFPLAERGGALTARVPVADLPDGTWTMRLRVGAQGNLRSAPVQAQPGLAEKTWRKSRRFASAKLVESARTLTLEVNSQGVAGRVLSKIRGR